MGLGRDGGRVFWFFDEACHRAVVIEGDATESASFFPCDGDGGDGAIGTDIEVFGEHLSQVHFVDVVASEHANDIRGFVGDDVLRLVHGVDGAFEPAFSGALLSGDGFDEVIEDGGHSPGAGDVFFEACAFVLGEDFDTNDARVHEVGQHDIDEAISATEGDEVTICSNI